MDAIEFPCPFCSSVHSFREADLPPSGEIACPGCGETLAVQTSTPALLDSSPVAAEQPAPAAAEQAPAAGMQTRQEDVAVSHEGNVSCPACGHLFDPSAHPVGEQTILVVEDNEFFRDAAVEALAPHYTTLSAGSAAQARQVLATKPVALVLLDLSLPDADGTEVLKAMPRKGIPVLIYTSEEVSTPIGPEWDRLQALGARDTVEKSVNVEDALVRKVRGLLEPVAV